MSRFLGAILLPWFAIAGLTAEVRIPNDADAVSHALNRLTFGPRAGDVERVRAQGRVAVFLPSYERDAIRPHVLGRFRDLLGATAQHPAMLFYLDNWLSVDPAAQDRRPERKRRGLNENYARELLELHSLGVDGGYSQDDVVNVARAFTGVDDRRTRPAPP